MVAMAGMQANAAGVAGKVSYYGWVTIGDSPCPGAVVKLNYNGVDHTTTTNLDGSYNIGPVTFVAGAQPEVSTIWGGQTLSRATPNTDAMVNKQSFDFPPAVIFKGSVKYNGVPVGGATVTLKYGGYMWTFATDSDGSYRAGAFYYGGQASLVASYSNYMTPPSVMTPQQDSTILTNFAIDGTMATVTPQQNFYCTGRASYTGSPVSGIEIKYSYMGDINSVTAGDDGSYNFSSSIGTGDFRYWAVYNGIESPAQVISPSAGQTYNKDFNIVASASATPVPSSAATVAPTSGQQNQNSPAPGSATPAAVPTQKPAATENPQPGLLDGIPTIYILLALGIFLVAVVALVILALRT